MEKKKLTEFINANFPPSKIQIYVPGIFSDIPGELKLK